MNASSAPEYHSFNVQTCLPTITFEFGIKMLLYGPANTEVSDEGPCLWHFEYSTNDFRLEDRNPANSQPLGARGKPHGKSNQIITGKVDVLGRGRVQCPRQVAREDRPVHRLVTQFDANFSTIAIDEFCSLLPTNQSHVVTRHQQLCRQQ